MAAGEGAEREASRHARRVDRLRAEQHRTGDPTGEIRAAAERAARQHDAWASGADGERRVARALVALEVHGWVALHDVRWPGRTRANIDHIVIGPGGVVVVDAKKWSGEVTVRGGTLRQNGYRRSDALEGVAAATAEVAALLMPAHRVLARSVICLVGHRMPSTMADHGVTVVGLEHLAAQLRSLPARLTAAEVADIARYLDGLLGRTPPRPDRAQRSATPLVPVVRHPAAGHHEPGLSPAASALVAFLAVLVCAPVVGGLLLAALSSLG
ncbi:MULTISPECIES: nuclease-related domain-containing protein [unclassified Actinotalea]|uniref:nuclease-related domain-containing protein n=1 Tax=unclassified Actinotalea TaxID=2638618 RepID=UPI0015F35E69|nr:MULTISPECIES: nuclease-related domain-containing protein [unclassified Actinotalea]